MVRRQLASIGFPGEVLRVDVLNERVGRLRRPPVVHERRSEVAILLKVLLCQQRIHAICVELQILRIILVTVVISLLSQVYRGPLRCLQLLRHLWLDRLLLLRQVK